MEQNLRREAEELRERSRGEASLVHARAVAEDSKAHESLQKGVASMKLKEQSQASKVYSEYSFHFYLSSFLYFACFSSCVMLLARPIFLAYELLVLMWVIQEETQFLVDNLEKYEAFIGAPGSKEPPRIAQIPPPFQSVPCRPIVLDTALTTLEFPSLQGRLKKKIEKKNSVFFGLFNRR